MENINVNDLIDKAKTKGRYLTSFLSPAEIYEIKEKIKRQKDISCIEYSMHDFSLERNKILLVSKEDKRNYNDDYDYEIKSDNVDFKIDIIRIKPNKFARELKHKDYLGSILGLGLKREKVGDIFVLNNNEAIVLVSCEISEYVLDKLDYIGREKVELNIANEDFIKSLDTKDDSIKKELKLTSLRLDNVISHSYGISRKLSVDLIEKGYVKLNHTEISNVSKEIKENDLISVRGYGRIEIENLGGLTKKGKLNLNVKILKSKQKR